MKIRKENAGFIFIIFILLGLLGVSIYLGVSGWYFYSEQNYTTDMQLGQTFQIDVLANKASALSLNLEGSYLPNEQLPQIISVKNIDDEKAVYLRAKIFIEGAESNLLPIMIGESANWNYNETDGYYYYNNVLATQNKCTLCSSVYTPNDVMLQTTKKYIVMFIIETIEDGQNVEGLWDFNPTLN
ncbi:MAG: hypothetical protein IJY90_01965 [Clostridia bacterium]|nr:hypothetical protein [Clostridia bacterium]